MKYYDIHSHLNDEQFSGDLENVIEKMRKEGVLTNVVGYDINSSRKALEIAGQYPDVVRAIVGIHPDEVEGDGFDVQWFEHMCGDFSIVAVGECGLDYFRTGRTGEIFEKQAKMFRAQIDWANSNNLPVMVHIRPSKDSYDAYEDAFYLIKVQKEKYPDQNFNIHFFAGGLDWARQFVEIGCTLSFTGVITFAKEYEEVVEAVPIENIMVETDAPYVAPVPFRGRRAEPVHVKEIVRKVAEIKGRDEDEVAEIIFDTSMRIYGF